MPNGHNPQPPRTFHPTPTYAEGPAAPQQSTPIKRTRHLPLARRASTVASDLKWVVFGLLAQLWSESGPLGLRTSRASSPSDALKQ